MIVSDNQFYIYDCDREPTMFVIVHERAEFCPHQPQSDNFIGSSPAIFRVSWRLVMVDVDRGVDGDGRGHLAHKLVGMILEMTSRMTQIHWMPSLRFLLKKQKIQSPTQKHSSIAPTFKGLKGL